MSISNSFKHNQILRGILFSVLSLIILEFGTVAVIAGFTTAHILEVESNKYYLLLVLNAIIAGLLGIGIAKKMRTIKRIAYILNLTILVIIIASYAFFIWFRHLHNV